MGYHAGNNDMLLRKIKAILLCLLMILLLNGFVSAAYTVLIDLAPYSFTYRRTITIQASQVQGGPHGNFPMLFDSTTTAGLPDDLKHVGEVPPGKVENSNGWDIVFAMGEDQEILKHEIDEYYPSTGDYLAWVRIVSLSGSTQFYMYYGSAGVESASKNTQHVNEVWDSNYVGVWHLKESGNGSVDEYKDSTQYTNHGIGGLTDGIPPGDSNYCPTRISDGQIGYGQSFSITPDSNSNSEDEGDLIDVGNSTDDPELDITGKEITIEFWMRYASATHPNIGPLNHKGWSNGYRFLMNQNSQEMRVHLPGNANNLSTNENISTNAWHHVAATYEGVTDQLMRIYVDGLEKNTMAKNDNILSAAPEEAVWIGHGDQGWDVAWSYPWDGDLDEVRISDSERNGDWIKTEYNNQKNPDTFYTVEAEQTLVELSYFRATSLDSAVLLEWATAAELDNAGFNLWRSEEEDGEYVRINPYFISAQGDAGFGAKYSYMDYDVQNGVIYYYKLEDIDIYGKSAFHGPVPAIPNDIIPIWPPDRIIRPSDALFFNWSSSERNSFKVEISSNPSFPSSETVSFPEEEWTSSNSLWLSPLEWEMVLRKATQSGGQLFWRIRARIKEGRVVSSDWQRFVVKRLVLPEK